MDHQQLDAIRRQHSLKKVLLLEAAGSQISIGRTTECQEWENFKKKVTLQTFSSKTAWLMHPLQSGQPDA